MNRLDHVVIDNLNNYKDQRNEAINSDPTFDTSNFNLSSSTSNTLPIITVSLGGGNKYRATTASGLICLWESGAKKFMIKRRHTNHYERKMWSNKVEYITAAGVHCTTHDVKENFACHNYPAAR